MFFKFPFFSPAKKNNIPYVAAPKKFIYLQADV